MQGIKMICFKCGAELEISVEDYFDHKYPEVCTVPMLHRTSGICGGAYVTSRFYWLNMGDENTIDNDPV